ncbi:hypothetical protein [Brucella anthropi]|uniref:hypothetical protein n=1 Tax=Brucella anthropi TaxID=529 RepID=UPI0023628157|nr:hypothetical protein [Brucella anthropi]
MLKLLLGLQRASSGNLSFRGELLDTRSSSFMRDFHRAVQAVFQDTYSSLDPCQRVFDIIADEVISALDLTMRARIIDLMRCLSKQTTFEVVLHDIALVALLCEQLIVLEKGRIVGQGETRDILDHPPHAFTRKLLTSLPRTSLPA